MKKKTQNVKSEMPLQWYLETNSTKYVYLERQKNPPLKDQFKKKSKLNPKIHRRKEN